MVNHPRIGARIQAAFYFLKLFLIYNPPFTDCLWWPHRPCIPQRSTEPWNPTATLGDTFTLLILRGQWCGRPLGFSNFLITVTKHLAKPNLKKEGFILNYDLGYNHHQKILNWKSKNSLVYKFQITLIIVYCYKFPTLFLIIISFFVCVGVLIV